MRSLLHVVAGRSQAGVDLPEILPALSTATIKIRQGQLHVVAGLPSNGKTLFALWYAISCGLPVLYFSLDSDEGTVSNRASAILTGRTIDEVKRMREGPAVVEIEDALSELTDRVRFDFDSQSMDDIYEVTESWVELFGDVPSLIIVDNLLNLVGGGGDSEFTGMRDHVNALHGLARETGSAVMLLHHVNASLLNSPSKQLRIRQDRPAPAGALMGQVSQLPETILSVALDGDRFWVAAVKNRDGLRDPQAENPIAVAVDASRASLFNDHRALEVARTRREWQ